MSKYLIAAKIAENGLAYYNVADKLGVSKNTFSKRMSDPSKFTAEEILKLCDILGIQEDSEKCRIFLSSPSQ